MFPKIANSLTIFPMNLGGTVAKMIKTVMKQKNVDSLPVMIEKASNLAVKFIACTMSVTIMGTEKKELFVFIEYGGVMS